LVIAGYFGSWMNFDGCLVNRHSWLVRLCDTADDNNQRNTCREYKAQKKWMSLHNIRWFAPVVLKLQAQNLSAF
jgi:hypothetical protein